MAGKGTQAGWLMGFGALIKMGWVEVEDEESSEGPKAHDGGVVFGAEGLGLDL